MKRNATISLVSSIIALVICCSVLVGATFAWFTDTASVSVNVVETGTLKVDLQVYDGNTWGNTFPSLTNFEPGATKVVYLKVANRADATLASKYSLSLNFTDTNLSNALEWCVVDKPDDALETGYVAETDWASLCNGNAYGDFSVVSPLKIGDLTNSADVDYFALALHLKENADDTFQNKSSSFNLEVFATQLAYESDSTGSNYNEKAWLTRTWTRTLGISAPECYIDITDMVLASAGVEHLGGVGKVDISITANQPAGTATAALCSMNNPINGVTGSFTSTDSLTSTATLTVENLSSITGLTNIMVHPTGFDGSVRFTISVTAYPAVPAE